MMYGMRPQWSLLLLGHLLFLGLFTLAFIHTVPRVVHVDSAFQIFKWIEEPGVGVEAHRYTAIIPQLLVKVAVGLDLPLSTLFLVASIAHVLVPYMIFVVIAHGLRQPWLAMGVVLAQVLCTRLTFYGMVLEANYLLSYPFLLAAALERRTPGPDDLRTGLPALLTLLLVLLVHPVGALIALFVLLHRYQQGGVRSKLLIAFMALTLTWPLLARFIFPPTTYEAGLYNAMVEGAASPVPFTRLPAFRFLVEHTALLTTFYAAFWCVLVVTLILQARRKGWMAMALMVGAVVLFILIHVWAYHAGETAMMMEKNFVPLAVLVALPLMVELDRLAPRTQWWSILAIAVVLFIQFRGISFASRPAKERLQHIVSLVEYCREQDVRKACVSTEALDEAGLHLHWALAFETLLLSAHDGPAGSITVVARKDPPASNACADFSRLMDESRVCVDGSRYFHLPIGAYVVLSPR